jgi:Phosphatidylinositol-4-phosphate 5-Kinase
MLSNEDSLLVRITDFLSIEYPAIGTLGRCTPSHHVIMENILCDKHDDEREPEKWETYDLKPVGYFYPGRDLVPKPLVNEKLGSRPYDEFKDKIRITHRQYHALRKAIEEDTRFLRLVNTVDYSLFLVRFPAHLQPESPSKKTKKIMEWRKGAVSTDGKWKYRAVLLDFFWAKHKLQAQAMTGAVQTFNTVGRQGPMSITTTAKEYRDKFLEMLDGLVELQG